jgi:hypothetical protein
MKNVYLWYVAVEGAKIAVVLGWSGNEGLAGPGSTGYELFNPGFIITIYPDNLPHVLS